MTEHTLITISGISGVFLMFLSSMSILDCSHPTETAIFGAALTIGAALDKLRLDLLERK